MSAHDSPGMGQRGVSRPMPLMGSHDHGDEDHAQHEHADEGENEKSHHQHDSGGHGHEMSHDDRRQMLAMHHQQTLWVYWTLVMLGIWTALAPFTFGYLNEQIWVDPSGGRGAWWSDGTHTQLRAILMTVSDVVSGLLLIVFGWRSLTPNRPISLWICCGIGVWLTFAPVLFWSPTAGAYLNDTLVGALVIALSILIPGMPNMIMYMQMGSPTPPGWTYNPSSWPQRWIMIVAGFAGWIVSRYLAMYQLGYIDYVWDPFFSFQAGTQKVLDSKMSHSLPISDAGLGAISYTFEFLMGFMGSPSRWRTMPWMVTFFGILVIPLGLVHIFLVISQPVMVGHWCTFCLLAAAIMLPMIPLEVDEVVAMGQHMVDAKKRGDRGGSLWTIFWKGGQADGCTPDERSPKLAALPQKPWDVFIASIWGMSFPWTLTVSSILGAALMFLPTLFGISIEETAADVAHLGGALIVTVSVICMGEVLRIGRYLNVLLGLTVAAAPWMLEGAETTYSLLSTTIGVLVIALAVPLGPKTERYAGWDRYIR
jgi:uncharacterized membrane protein